MTLLRTIRGTDVTTFEGEIDLSVADEALQTILQAAETGASTVDMSGVTFMDSSGLNTLLQAARSMNGNGPLVIRRPSEAVRRVFDIALPTGAPGLVIDDDGS